MKRFSRPFERVVLVLALGCACALAAGRAGTDDPRLGLTRDQLLAMDSDAWVDYYAARKGDSAAALAAACDAYADALRSRTTDRLKGLKDAARLRRWYKTVATYGDLAFRIQSRSGGEAWTALGAAQRVDVELYFDRLVGLELKPDKTPTVDLYALGDRVLDHHAELARRIAALPTRPAVGIGRAAVSALNAEAKLLAEKFLPELEKAGGQQAFATLDFMSRLSEPDALIDASGER